MRPLNTNPNVQLMFEESKSLPPMFTDEAKVSQILRNFVSNAIKFTERGEIRVSSVYIESTDTIAFHRLGLWHRYSRRRNRSACSSSIIRSIVLDNER